MKRKDCEHEILPSRRGATTGAVRSARWTLLAALVVGAPTADAPAGTVHLWSSAVVVDDRVLLSDLCELKGFDQETERRLGQLTVAEAPPAGGSRLIHLAMIRSVLTGSGANMATVSLGGTTRCTVTRPSESARVPAPAHQPATRVPVAKRSSRSTASAPPATLRQAVLDHFQQELVRYNGRPEVVFDRAAKQVLELSGPAYEFQVRRRTGPPLGLIQLEVGVLADRQVVQSVPLVVQVSMIRPVVVARHAVNQGATIRTSDVGLSSLSLTRVDRLGLDRVAQAIGQRAKRFITAGSIVEPAMLESVPLVTRGQLVQLTSVAGGVRVVTTAKALRDGLLGETITVRSADRRRVELDAVVVGPGAVQAGGAPPAVRGPRVAMGGSS